MNPETEFLIDFNVPNVAGNLGLPIPPRAAAAMLDIDETEYLDYCARAAAQVSARAIELLDETEIARAIHAWDIPRGAKVLTIGDSITTYRYSYAELLRAMLAHARAADAIQVVNCGMSGYTSSLAREVTYTQYLAHAPQWVLIMYGVNDCKRFGSPDARTLVSQNEYIENMRAVIEAFRAHTQAKIILLTPTPVVENVVNTNADISAMRLTWSNRDLAAFAAQIGALARETDIPCVDLFSVFGMNPDAAWYVADGLHPNFLGQQHIARALLRVLAALPQ